MGYTVRVSMQVQYRCLWGGGGDFPRDHNRMLWRWGDNGQAGGVHGNVTITKGAVAILQTWYQLCVHSPCVYRHCICTQTLCVHRHCICTQTLYIYTTVYVHRHCTCTQTLYMYRHYVNRHCMYTDTVRTQTLYVHRRCICTVHFWRMLSSYGTVHSRTVHGSPKE